MVEWVLDAARSTSAFERVVVATDDDEIAEVVRRAGGEAEMTRPEHRNGTERVAEVAERADGVDVVVNVQGDQPFATATMLEALLAPYERGEAPEMVTLGAPIEPGPALDDPNTVKVVCDRKGRALYFSRSPIPYLRTPGPAPVFHHVGLYAFRRDFLAAYPTLEPTPLEEREALEQLRALEHGYEIVVSPIEEPILEVNTPEDLAEARSRIDTGGTQ